MAAAASHRRDEAVPAVRFVWASEAFTSPEIVAWGVTDEQGPDADILSGRS